MEAKHAPGGSRNTSGSGRKGRIENKIKYVNKRTDVAGIHEALLCYRNDEVHGGLANLKIYDI